MWAGRWCVWQVLHAQAEYVKSEVTVSNRYVVFLCALFFSSLHFVFCRITSNSRKFNSLSGWNAIKPLSMVWNRIPTKSEQRAHRVQPEFHRCWLAALLFSSNIYFALTFLWCRSLFSAALANNPADSRSFAGDWLAIVRAHTIGTAAISEFRLVVKLRHSFRNEAAGPHL